MQLPIEIDYDKLRDFCRRWKITEFSLFGSILRDDFGPESDVDVLVRLSPEMRKTLYLWFTMQEELEAIFGRRVDLIDRGAVEESTNRFRRTAILGSAVLLDVA